MKKVGDLFTALGIVGTIVGGIAVATDKSVGAGKEWLITVCIFVGSCILLLIGIIMRNRSKGKENETNK